MLVLVTLLGAAPVAGRYYQIGVSGSLLCWQRWSKRWDADESGFPCSRLVASIMVDSPLTLLLCMYRKRVTARSRRKTLAGAL